MRGLGNTCLHPTPELVRTPVCVVSEIDRPAIRAPTWSRSLYFRGESTFSQIRQQSATGLACRCRKCALAPFPSSCSAFFALPKENRQLTGKRASRASLRFALLPPFITRFEIINLSPQVNVEDIVLSGDRSLSWLYWARGMSRPGGEPPSLGQTCKGSRLVVGDPFWGVGESSQL